MLEENSYTAIINLTEIAKKKKKGGGIKRNTMDTALWGNELDPLTECVKAKSILINNYDS